MIIRRIARPLLATAFIGQGVETLLNTDSGAEAVRPALDQDVRLQQQRLRILRRPQQHLLDHHQRLLRLPRQIELVRLLHGHRIHGHRDRQRRIHDRRWMAATYRHRLWIERLLSDYYDPLYQRSLQANSERIVFRGDADACFDYLQQLQFCPSPQASR